MDGIARIEIGGIAYEKTHLITTPAGQAALRGAKDSPVRPHCLCNITKPEMYISRRGGHFFLSRMPSSGNEHAEWCRSHITEIFEKSPESGGVPESTAGQLLEQTWDIVRSSGEPKNKTWAAIQKAVRESLKGVIVDGVAVTEHLLIPDTFKKESASDLKSVYDAFYKRQFLDPDKQVRYWTFGMLKAIIERQYSYQATLKHMPDTKFWVHKDLFDIFPTLPRAEGEMVLCLFSCRRTPSGVEVDEAATLLMDEHNQPIDWTHHLSDAPTDEQVEKARIAMGLPVSAGRDAVFGTLVAQFLGNIK